MREGLCGKCGEWFSIVSGHGSGLPEHNVVAGDERCPDSGYSAQKTRYRVRTKEEARTVADMILQDTGGCLNGLNRMHTIDCGDGRECTDERLRIAQALAAYVSVQC